MKKTMLYLLILIVCACAAMGYAEEAVPQTSPAAGELETFEPSEFVFPKVKPEFHFWTGYRYIHIDGDKKVEEFEYPHSSLVLGGETRIVSYPHRLHLDFEIRNEKDYYGDISYAYKDLVLFRGINSTLWHNLENIRYFNLPSTATPTVTQEDDDREYGIKVGMTNLLLRFKTPDFPAHLYFEAAFVTKDGTFQQRFMGGSAGFGAGTITNKVTEKRELDTLMQSYTVGANSHLGPIEVDYSHTEKRFDVDADRKPSYTYLAGTLPAGRYEHNVMSEFKSSTDTIRFHTNYTGRIVASGTLSWTGKENRDNSATADYFYGAGDITLMPIDTITFFLKYRHKESDHDSPGMASIRNLNAPYQVYSSLVYEPVSSVSDVFSAAVRLRVLPTFTVRGEFTFESIRREHAEYWNEPERTDKSTLLLSADMKIYKSLKLKLRYKQENIDDPAHNTEPEERREGYAALSWAPLQGLTTFLSYTNKHESRSSVHYLYTPQGSPIELQKNLDGRDVYEDRFTGVVNYTLLRNLGVTGTYSYLKNVTKQDLAYACNTFAGICAAAGPLPRPGTAFEDSMVPFKTLAQTYSVDVSYSPIDALSLTGGVAFTMTKGRFYPSSVLGQQMIDDFSELKTRETIYSASAEYRFKNGLGAGLQYRYSTFNNATGNSFDDVNDGRAHFVLLTLTKKW